MTKNQILALAIGAAGFGLTSCNGTGGFKKTSDGLLYKMIVDEKTDEVHPDYGDQVEMYVHIRIGDSVLFDSRKIYGPEPVKLALPEPGFKSEWVTGVKLMTAGDSAQFFIPVDTAKKYAEAEGGVFPPFATSKDTVVYSIKLVSVAPAADVKKKAEEALSKQKELDDQKLQAYFAEKGISPNKTESGLYYTIDKQGSGPNIERGQIITVNYTGTNLEGKAFDSNVDPQFNHVEPFQFPAGVGQVIPGWDEGLMLLNKGSKAHFYIPSTLAYGQRDMGGEMGANAILIFDVEVVKIEDAPAAPQQ